MKELSVIIPFVNEWPQIIFTVDSLASSLEAVGAEYEIIVVDNCSQREEDKDGNNEIRAEINAIIDKCIRPTGISKYELGNEFENYVHGRERQGHSGDRTSLFMKEHRWIKEGRLKYIRYDNKLSHWNAKNEALKVATGKVCGFVDAHNLVSGSSYGNMLRHYQQHEEWLNGSLHMPVHGLMESPDRAQEYKIHYNKPQGTLSYGFTPIKIKDQVHKVPSMIYCSVMISREIVDKLGFWPESLGIWSGGEQYANFALAVCGYDVNVYPFGTMKHFAGGAVSRGYCYNFWDMIRNRMIAVYCVCGVEWLHNYTEHHCKDALGEGRLIAENVIETCGKWRQIIEKNQTIEIEEWVERWKETKYMGGYVA